MAHPKRKTSKTRRDKRRTHVKAAMPTIGIDATTGEAHVWHRGYFVDGNFYYRGKLVFTAEEE